MQSIFAYRVNIVLTSHFGQGSAPRFINSFCLLASCTDTEKLIMSVSLYPERQSMKTNSARIQRYRVLYSILGIGQEVRGYERGAAGLKGNEGRVG